MSVAVKAVADSPAGKLVITLADGKAEADVPALKAGEEHQADVKLHCTDVTPWGLMDGHLYDLRAVLEVDGKPADDLIDRVGFRTVTLEGEDPPQRQAGVPEGL